MKTYLSIYALIAIIGATQTLSAENTIKRGDATVNIIFDGDTESLPQLGAAIYASTPFDENNMSQEFKFESNDKGFTANIPLLTRESIEMIRITLNLRECHCSLFYPTVSFRQVKLQQN